MLTGKKISGEKNEHVLNVWNKFKMKTMKDYHNLYLKYEVLLLADVFEEFKNNSHEELLIMSKSLFDCTRLKLGWNA